eukprot:6480319-Amphidinium_carterae.1
MTFLYVPPLTNFASGGGWRRQTLTRRTVFWCRSDMAPHAATVEDDEDVPCRPVQTAVSACDAT